METKLNNSEGVELLKKATDVSGRKLIHKMYTDKQVDSQISLLVGMHPKTRDLIRHEESRIVNAIDYSLPKEEVYKFIESEIKSFLGFSEEVIEGFWKNFGSALILKEHESMSRANIGMDRIFGTKFTSCSSFVHGYKSYINTVIEAYEFKIKSTKKEIFSSKYNTLKELEENVTIKNSKAQARIFWMDKSKTTENRMDAFDAYGECASYIHEPKHIYLQQLFHYMLEENTEHFDRGSEEECREYIDNWIYRLSQHRTRLNHTDNIYRSKFVKSERGYEPSEKALERLRSYYYEILMDEGVSSFKMDW